jgi:hypothetical protein
MTGYLALASSTGSSFTHDILVFAHYLFEYAFLVLSLGIIFLLYRSSEEVRIWHIAIPLVLGWLATGQYEALLNATEKISHGGAAHLGTAVSDVSVGTLLVLVGLIIGLVVMIRRGRQ